MGDVVEWVSKRAVNVELIQMVTAEVNVGEEAQEHLTPKYSIGVTLLTLELFQVVEYPGGQEVCG